MVKAIFPGSFDPITNGHLDIIERAATIVDNLTVLLVSNSAKLTMFSMEERLSHLEYLTKYIENVNVKTHSGLTVKFAQETGASIMIRGLRNGGDFDYELQIAEVNKKVVPDIETLFITTKPEFSYLSSSIVKEIFSYGGNIDSMVHCFIAQKMNEKKTNGSNTL